VAVVRHELGATLIMLGAIILITAIITWATGAALASLVLLATGLAVVTSGAITIRRGVSA
jgi:hypothetical protein